MLETMRVDGRDITVSGSLLQPLTRRTNDILRLVLAAVFLAAVITSSLITRNEWVALEKSISEIVGVLTPDPVQPGLSGVRRRDPGAAVRDPDRPDRRAAVEAARRVRGGRPASPFSRCRSPATASPRRRWHFDLSDRLDTLLSQFLDDPRWIAMLAAVLTVSGPWLPARWRRWWWALLLAFVPIHLVVSAVVPARSLLGPGGRLVRRRAGRARGRDARPRGAARRRRPRAGPARIRGDRR